MAIQFECPSCGRDLKAPDDKAGKRGRCPHCQSPIEVPEPVYQAEEVPVAEEASDPGVYQLAPQPEPTPEEDRRPCPACGELIKTSAVKCRFCGEIFDPTLRRAARKQRSHSSEDSYLSGVDWALAILCGNIACIVAIVYMIQSKPKGLKMLGITVAVQCAIYVVFGIIEAMAELP